MQRIRVLAALTAVGLGTLGLVLLLSGDDLPPPVAVSTDGLPPDTSATPEPLASTAPGLGTETQAEVALRREQARWAAIRRRSKTTIAQLATRPGWTRFLATWVRLPGMKDDAEKLAKIQAAFAQAKLPVVRQNLIFLAALVLPLEAALPWLQALAAGDDAADAEDALVALAFSGSAPERAAFERLAADVAAAKVRRLVDYDNDHDRIATQGDGEARDVLRSWRAIEAFLREPYFKRVALHAGKGWKEVGTYAFGKMVGWVDGAGFSRQEAVDLLRAWLRRYPGHPGGDDMANRIAWMHVSQDDLRGAARWFSRAAVLPDQDVARGSVRSLASLCEIDLAPEDVLLLSEDEGLSTPNRSFLQYVWLRRLAAERGFDVALRELEDFVGREPESDVAVAWRSRYLVAPPQGLDSGVTPLPATDPLRRRERGSIAWPKRKHPSAPAAAGGIYTGRWGEDTVRLKPWPEPVVLDRGRLPRQLRVWMTLAELERRTKRAHGEARADLLYKQAAVFFHQRDALFPMYGRHTHSFSGMLSSLQHGDSREATRALRKVARARFESTTVAYVRSMDLFEQIEREHAGWAGMDKVVYSEGLLWRRLVDYRPSVHHVYWWTYDKYDALAAIRNTAETFDRLVRLFPDSPLAGSARAASAWWRKARPNAFRR